MPKEYSWQVVITQETNHGTRIFPIASFLTAGDAGDFLASFEALSKDVDYVVDYSDLYIRKVF